MKNSIFIFFALILFGCAATKQKGQLFPPASQGLDFNNLYKLDCYSCDLTKEIKCSDCKGEISASVFTGIILSSSSQKDIVLHAPVIIDSKGQNITFKDAFGTSKTLSISQITNFSRVIEVLDEVADWACNSTGGGGGGAGDPDTDTAATRFFERITAGQREMCLEVSDIVNGGTVSIICFDLEDAMEWNCDSTLQCLDGMMNIVSTSYPDGDSTAIVNCIQVGTQTAVCDTLRLSVPCEIDFEEDPFLVANDLDNSFTVAAGVLPANPDCIWVWRNGKKYSFGTGYTYTAGTGEVQFSVVNTLATDHVTIRTKTCK